jgi:hypothetical protein
MGGGKMRSEKRKRDFIIDLLTFLFSTFSLLFTLYLKSVVASVSISSKVWFSPAIAQMKV